MCKKRQTLYKKFISRRAVIDERIYKSFRNKCTKAIQKTKQQYFQSKFCAVTGNSKATWKEINTVLNRTKIKKNIPSKIVNDNNDISHPREMANEFNKYFISIGPNLQKKLDDPHDTCNKHFSKYLSNPCSSSIFFQPIVESEIISIVDKFKNDTSSGFDHIDVKVVKKVIPFICKPLSQIFNMSMSTGLVPDNLKVAKVIPVFKSGSKECMSNYRPISVLTVFSKIIEKCVFSRISNFLSSNNLLNSTQYGFREGLSTSLAITKLTQDITNSIETKKTTVGVFLDMSKAFDTIDHNILMQKLYHIGIRGVPHKWIENYLSNRKQYVTINSTDSNMLNVVCGVPQGSILGPLLFLIYINDIQCSSNVLSFIQFADDTSIFFTHKDIPLINTTFNKELQNVYQWLKCNKLIINMSKTNYMVFSNMNYNIDDIRIHMDKSQLLHTNHTKFLGVHIDESMSWKYHLGDVCSKISQVVGILYRLRNLLPEKILLTIYNTLFLPHISYCNINWGGCPKSYSDRVFKLQKKAIRLISKSSYNSHSAPLFHKLNVLSLSDICQLQTGMFMYKCKNRLLPRYITDLFPINASIHSYQTRSSNDFHFPKIRTSYAKSTLFFTGPKLWSSLPNEIKNSVSLQSFKRKLKKHLINSYRNQLQR